MKKIIAMLLVLTMAMGLIACGNNNGGNAADGQGNSASGDAVIDGTGDATGDAVIDGTGDATGDAVIDGTSGTEDASNEEGTSGNSDKKDPTTSGKEPSIGVEVEPGDIEVEIGVDTTEGEETTEPTGGLTGGNMIDFDDLLG